MNTVLSFLPFSSLRSTRTALLVCAVALLAACGFQPRAGALQYPFKVVAMDAPRTAQTTIALRQRMQAGGTVRFVPRTVVAGQRYDAVDVILDVVRDDRGTIVRGQNVNGEIRELSLVRYFDFRLLRADGTVLMDTVKLRAERDTTYTEEEEVTKRDDREVLYRGMAEDLARQASYRLAALKR